MKKTFVGLFLFVFTFINGASAEVIPSEWQYMMWPFMYNFNNSTWYFLDVGSGEQWCCNVQSMQWGKLGQNSPPDGFTYFQMPFAYSHSASAWYYFKPSDTFWLCNMSTNQWTEAGEQEAQDQGLAPESLQSGTINGVTTEATYSEDLGSFTYIMSNGSFTSGSQSGTYTYTKTGDDTARITFNTTDGYSGTINLEFTSANSGTFVENYSGPYSGQNSGTFTYSD